MSGQSDIYDQRQSLYLDQVARRSQGMNGQDPFAHYSYMNQQPQMTPDTRRQQVAQQFQQQILGQTPTTAAGGVAALAAGIGRGINKYQQEGKQFPTAPGGALPSFATTLGNFFTGRNNGGLY